MPQLSVDDDDTTEITTVSSTSPTNNDVKTATATAIDDNNANTNTNELKEVQESIAICQDEDDTITTKNETATTAATTTTTQNQQQEEKDQNDTASALPKEELTKEEDTIDCINNTEALQSTEPNTVKKLDHDGDGDDKSKQAKTGDDDEYENIEWLTSFSLPRAKESVDDTSNTNDATNSNDKQKSGASILEPFKMLKKGAVAVAGGTMVGVGLVMIPLPTPFGAVVASSGLAVLGTEFGEAKQLNDRLIGGAKGHLSNARDAIVEGIENMNSQHDRDDDDDYDEVEDSNEGDNGTVVKVDAACITNRTGTGVERGSSSNNSNDNNEKSDNNDNNSNGNNNNNGGGTNTTTDSPPVWLHMNPIERTRQIKLAKEKYRRENQSSLAQAKEAFTKRTGKFLSRNVLPYIKKKNPPPVPEAQTEDFTAGSIAPAAEKDDKLSTQGINDVVTVTNQEQELLENKPEWIHSDIKR